MRRFQVIKGGKGESGSPRRSEIKLFKAHSFGKFSKGDLVFNDVRFNWYCLERRQKPHLPSELIANYSELDENTAAAMERDLSKCFTQEEIEELRLYIFSRYGMNVIAEEAPLPLAERMPLFEEGSSVIYDFLELSDFDDYSLDFKVWGYYTLQNCISSHSLDEAVRFLTKALDLLGLAPRFTSEQLEMVSKTIYEEDGLIVSKKKEK